MWPKEFCEGGVLHDTAQCDLQPLTTEDTLPADDSSDQNQKLSDPNKFSIIAKPVQLLQKLRPCGQTGASHWVDTAAPTKTCSPVLARLEHRPTSSKWPLHKNKQRERYFFRVGRPNLIEGLVPSRLDHQQPPCLLRKDDNTRDLGLVSKRVRYVFQWWEKKNLSLFVPLPNCPDQLPYLCTPPGYN